MNNDTMQAQMRQIARELLTTGAVERVIGWEQGTLWYQATPVLIQKPEEADKLIWNDYCQPNPADTC